MAGLEATMHHARQKLGAEPVHRSQRHAEAGEIDSDIAKRLQRLDNDQLAQVAEALGRRVDGGDVNVLRKSVADWVDEWAQDVAAEREDEYEDPEAAREAGHQEAIASLEEELERLQKSTPDNSSACET